jgi:hypothetical protein
MRARSKVRARCVTRSFTFSRIFGSTRGRRFAAGIDCFSSAAFFDGWLATPRQRDAIHGLSIRIRGAPASPQAQLRGGTVTFRSSDARTSQGHYVVPARTWLARVGWRRIGLISLNEQPARPQ